MIRFCYRYKDGDESGITTLDTEDYEVPKTFAQLYELERSIKVRRSYDSVNILSWSKFVDSFASPDGEAKQ